MALPSLTSFDETARSLHTLSMLLGLVRILSYEPLSNYLELGMKVLPEGLSTDRLANGGEVILDFKQCAIVYRSRAGQVQMFPLEGQSQAGVVEAVLTALAADDLSQALAGSSDTTIIERAVQVAQSRPRFTRVKVETYNDSSRLSVDPQSASDYADAVYSVFTAVARFRARLMGIMTPVVVWPEHFDLSTLWFHSDNTAMDAYKAHMNFGFAPYSPGIERPYLYAYAYPYPAQYDVPALPAGAHWHATGWTGVVVPYDTIRAQADPEQFIESTLEGIFMALKPLIGLS